MMTVHYLFYDNYNEFSNKNYEIDPYEFYEKNCTICNKNFYVKELYETHIHEE